MPASPPAHTTSPDPVLPTSKRRNTSDGASSGLRNSCESCASSKVKCSGRKPTCHRCETRGFACEYFQAKRAGRKPTASINTASNSSGSSSQPASEPGTNHEAAVVSEAAYASPKGTATELSNIWGDLNPLDCSLFFEMADNDTTSGFTPLFPMELPALDGTAPTAQMTSTDNLFPSMSDSSLNLGLGSLSATEYERRNDAVADLFDFPMPTPITAATLVAGGSQDFGQPAIAARPCSCLAQALGLIRRLSELMCSTNVASATQNNSDAIQTFQDILRQNKAAIDAITGMLNCQGRHDGYLLIVTCLTAFRIIELFHAILPEASGQASVHGVHSPQNRQPSMPPSAGSNATQLDGYSIGGEDWPRQAAQAILSELHSVRRLTKLLSEKLRLQTMATSPSLPPSRSSGTTTSTSTGASEVSPSSKDVAMSEVGATLPFSAEVYQQLGTDLNVRVRTLSQHVIHRLRSF